jgi:two-component system, chemotaxis family, sensor kinase CheA
MCDSLRRRCSTFREPEDGLTTLGCGRVYHAYRRLGVKNKVGVSIGTKLTFGTLAVLVLVSVLLYRELTRRERQSLLAAKQTAATMVADLFAATLSAPLDFSDNDAIETELRHLEKNPEVQCAAVFLREEKTPAAKIDRGCDATKPVERGDELRPVWHEDRVEVARYVVGREDAVVGRARVVFSLSRENAAFAESSRQIFWLTFLLAAGTAAVLIAISRTQIVKPLQRLSEAARRVGAGDLATRVDVRSADELGSLATTFNRMSEELQDRQRRLAAATQNLRDLFDHMGQAIVAFDREGKIRGAVSRQATRLFKAPSLEAHSVRELLFGENADGQIEAQAFKEWIETAFDVDVETWPSLAELAPTEVTRDGTVLELELRPVTKEGKVDRVMLLATDVTEKRRLEQRVATQEEEHAKRLAAMRKLVAGGAQLFVRFIESARERVAGFFERLDDDVALEVFDAALVDELFRHVHTMKGEARAFDLRELEAAFERVEQTLAELRKNAPALADEALRADAISAVRSGLFEVDKNIERTRADFVAASPIGRAALEQASVQRSDLEAVVALSRDRDDALSQAIRRLAARPFGEAVATIGERAPDWAARDGKRVEVVVEGREERVPAALADVLPGVLTHLVRNSIAHGIEPATDRTSRGKNPVGTVWISAVPSDAGPVIAVEDDGAGIDLARVAERARELGIAKEGVTPEDLVFAPGVSTRETSDGLAGRGVGLDAVRAYLGEVGYRVHFVTEPGNGTKFVLEPNAQ